LILIILEASLLQVVAWVDGTEAYPSIGTVYLLLPIWTWGSIGIINYLNTVALRSLDTYRDMLRMDDDEFKLLRFRFTTPPAIPLFLANIFFIGLFLFFVFVIPFKIISTWNSLTTTVMVLFGIPMFAIGSSFYAHVINMLIMVDRTYKASKAFNIYDREPIFAFSELTASSSVAILVFASLNILLIPSSVLDFGVFLFEATLVPIGLVVFILPLWEAHKRLVNVKRELQSMTERKIETTIAKLHRCLESDDSVTLEFLNKALASLVIERDIVEKLPTWPWRKGLLTGVASAVLLPTTLLVIQILIQRWIQS
jgi:hypothetical protein